MMSNVSNRIDHSSSNFLIQKIYLKDFSLEQPNAPKILFEQKEPKIEANVSIDIVCLDYKTFQVTLIGSILARIQKETLFLIEVHQSGIFLIESTLDTQQIHPILEVSCPIVLFPYLRFNVADIISRAGFQSIYLSDIDFLALYEQKDKTLKKV